MPDTPAAPGTEADAARQELLDRLLVERFATYPRKRVRMVSRTSEPSRAGGGTPEPRRAR
jgi:hypothetical protein